MSKITNAFDHGKALVAFVTCGDPDLATTGDVVRAAIENGADLIELGIPFSDPTAEGQIIQDSNLRALEGGITTDKVFAFIKDVCGQLSVPLVLMTYANVIFSYGAERFIGSCSKLGISGLIVRDIPFEEKEEFLPLCKQYNVDFLSFIVPAPANRIAMIAKEAQGFIYLEETTGEKGTSDEMVTDLEQMIDFIRKNTAIPCSIALCNHTLEQSKKTVMDADGIICDSGIVTIVAKHGREAGKSVGTYVKKMKDILRDLE